ncbi:MAG: hypothetical protein EOO38_32355 [Cytophagaceae bacterium]|nr:MAG: hypothetical protein EOO38_32355 [Cytophagaceae bacterium]
MGQNLRQTALQPGDTVVASAALTRTGEIVRAAPLMRDQGGEIYSVGEGVLLDLGNVDDIEAPFVELEGTWTGKIISVSDLRAAQNPPAIESFSPYAAKGARIIPLDEMDINSAADAALARLYQSGQLFKLFERQADWHAVGIDPDAIRAALEPLVPGILTISQSAWSEADLDSAIDRLVVDAEGLIVCFESGVNSKGGISGSVVFYRLSDSLAESLSGVPEDLVKVNVWLKPVHR